MANRAMVACALAVIVLGALIAFVPRADPQPQSWKEIIDRAEGMGLHWVWEGREDSACIVVSVRPIRREEAIRLVVTDEKNGSGWVKVYRGFGRVEGPDARWGRFDLVGDRSLIHKLINGTD